MSPTSSRAWQTPPTDVAGLLGSLLARPGDPRLTWYGPLGERIEVSGHVLDNWVAKTTNLLVEELDVGPGARLLLDLPPHWRTVVWGFAAWRVGATVLAPSGAPGRQALDDVDLVVTDSPGAHEAPLARDVVAVALPGLARRFEGELPAGAVDAAAAVMTYGDVIGWAPSVEPGRAALEGPGGTVTHADLVPTAVRSAPVAPGSRALLSVGEDRSTTAAVLLATLGVLAGDGSVVLLRPEPHDGPDRVDRLAASERVTVRV